MGHIEQDTVVWKAKTIEAYFLEAKGGGARSFHFSQGLFSWPPSCVLSQSFPCAHTSRCAQEPSLHKAPGWTVPTSLNLAPKYSRVEEVLKLGGKRLYPLNHAAGPEATALNDYPVVYAPTTEFYFHMHRMRGDFTRVPSDCKTESTCRRGHLGLGSMMEITRLENGRRFRVSTTFNRHQCFAVK